MKDWGQSEQVDFTSWWDSLSPPYADYTFDYLLQGASGITMGDNPPYTIEDFTNMYPQFLPDPDSKKFPPLAIYQNILQIYINLASASVRQSRWQDAWIVGMGSFVAHFMTLFLQSYAQPGEDVTNIVSKSLADGILVSKSVGDVHASYAPIVSYHGEWVGWNLTRYGINFIQLAQLIGKGMLLMY
jgi:hypothetical protein